MNKKLFLEDLNKDLKKIEESGKNKITENIYKGKRKGIDWEGEKDTIFIKISNTKRKWWI